MTLAEAIDKIDNNNCMLFVGSGFSYGAKGQRGILTTAADLTKELYIEAQGEEEPNGTLEDAAGLLADAKGEHALIEFLRDKFSVYEITQAQEYFGSLPWLRVYTTNYDNILDIAYQKHKKRIEHVYLSRHLRDYKDKSNLCVHLNGTVQNLNLETLNNEFKLTTASYLTDDFVRNEWVNLFISDLHTSDALFFVGYSMNYDLDIQRIVRNTVEAEEMKKKCFFVVREDESGINLRHLKKFGQPVAIGMERFVDLLAKRKPKENDLREKIFYCFDKPTTGSVVQNVCAQEAINLYVKGDINRGHILPSLIQPSQYRYFVKRDKLNNILKDLERGERQILIESNTGNGKTCFLESLAFVLSNYGYDVYYYKRHYETRKSEIEHVCTKSKNKVVFIIDNFSHLRSMLSELEIFRTEQIVIVADRTLSCDVSYEWLSKKFGEFCVYDIDKLSDDELFQIVEIFDNYGFFGSRASLRYDQKIEYLKMDCKSTMRDILLDLLNSETIKNRFEIIVNSIKGKKTYFEALVLMLISPIFGFGLDFNQLAFIFNKHSFTSPTFYNNEAIREFIDHRGTDIHVKSSILAECILSRVMDPEIVVDVLVKVFKVLDVYRSSEDYKAILRSLLSYQNLKRVLNPEHPGFSKNVTRFFEEISSTGFCDSNQHYWLQYAIARLFEHDYERSFRYFENAYSFAEKKKRDYGEGNYTYQIDNHFARYLLENEMENGTSETCMVAFNKAHSLLIDPKNKEIVRFYTYRVARNYYKFYETFYAKMKASEKKTFLRSCEEMYKRAKWYIQSKNALHARKGEAIDTKGDMIRIFNETNYVYEK